MLGVIGMEQHLEDQATHAHAHYNDKNRILFF